MQLDFFPWHEGYKNQRNTGRKCLRSENQAKSLPYLSGSRPKRWSRLKAPIFNIGTPMIESLATELPIPISICISSYRSVLSAPPLDNGWFNSVEVRHLVNSPASVVWRVSHSLVSDCNSRQESYPRKLLFERWHWESVSRLRHWEQLTAIITRLIDGEPGSP